MKMGTYLLLLLLHATITAAQNSAPQVTHVWAQQRANTYLVDVAYSVVDVDGDALTISLVLLGPDGVMICQCATVSGDVGAGIMPGANKYITWNAGADLSEQYGSDYTLRVNADDGASIEGFIYVAPGTFIMGSPANEYGWETDEYQHEVTLTHGVYVKTTEVTNQQYMDMAQWAYDNGYVTATSTYLYDNLDGSTQILKCLGSGGYAITFNNGIFNCTYPSHPAEYVSWYGSVAYCDWLSLQQGLPRAYDHTTWQCNGGNPYTAAGYRLPTEAEWEYACRAGSVTAFANGPIMQLYCDPIDQNLVLMGWYCGNAEGWTHPVAQKYPNAWGLYDMHGNLMEWCNDWYGEYGGAVTDPVGPGMGYARVYRSGTCYNYAWYCRSAYRDYCSPDAANSYSGFRPVRSAN
jgi:formylglycine-generating enzyme required for sulfatase activity